MITRGKIGFAVMALLYLVWNFVAAFSNGMQDSWDTSRYFGGVFDIQNPGFTTTLLFTTLKEPTPIMVALLVLSIFAWLALAWVIFQRLDYSPMRWPLIVILLVISMSTPPPRLRPNNGSVCGPKRQLSLPPPEPKTPRS